MELELDDFESQLKLKCLGIIDYSKAELCISAQRPTISKFVDYEVRQISQAFM